MNDFHLITIYLCLNAKKRLSKEKVKSLLLCFHHVQGWSPGTTSQMGIEEATSQIDLTSTFRGLRKPQLRFVE